jgi:O-antigen/teichoic acid export membrane protein
MVTRRSATSSAVAERRTLGIGALDQSISAIAAVALQLALARFLSPEAYGAYAVSFAVLLFFLGLHSNLVAEPMSVLGPAAHRACLFGYIRCITRLSTFLSMGLALAGALSALVSWIVAPSMTPALAAMSMAIVPYLLHALMRRSAYIVSRPDLALASSLAFSVALATGVSVLVLSNRLTAASALLLIGGASFAGSLPFLVTLLRTGTAADIPWTEIAGQNWRYGKWILAAGCAHWMGYQALFPIVGLLLGLAETGALRALSNLVAPIQQGLTVATLVLLPRFAAKAVHVSHRDILLSVFRLTIPASLAYGLVVIVWGQTLIAILYQQPAYNLGSRYLVAFAVYGVLMTAAHALSLSTRVRQETRAVFVSKLVGTLTVWLIGVPLIWEAGLWGAVLTLVLAAAAEAGLLGARLAWQDGPRN